MSKREEYGEMVTRAANKARDAILAEIKDQTPKDQWILYGRAVNVMLGSHFGMSLKITQDHLEAESPAPKDGGE